MAGCLDLAPAEAGVGALAKADQKNICSFSVTYFFLLRPATQGVALYISLYALPFNYINLWMVIYDPKPSK